MIRSVTSWFLSKTDVSNQLYKSMIRSFPGATLFPNLHSFSLPENCTDAALEFIKFLIGPRLEKLNVELTSESSATSRSSLMSSIPLSCPTLKKLDLGYGSLDLPAISEAVCQCYHLEDLTVPNLSETALIHISQLPRLRALGLTNIDSSMTVLTHFPSVPTPAFPVLEELNTRGGPISFDTSLHAVITSHKYQHYGGLFKENPIASNWKCLFAQLADMPQGLQSISFEHADKPPDDDNTHYLITPDAFRSILSIASITMLSMDSIFTFDLDDAFVLDLAKACPKLDFVILGTKWSSGRRSRATMMSYVHLLRHCPDMGTIGLAVDASNVDRESRINPAKGIKIFANGDRDFTFNVGDSYIEDPVAVAAFLSSLIDLDSEDIVEIFTADDCPPHIKEEWATVQELLPVFVAVRAQGTSQPYSEEDESSNGEDEDSGKETECDSQEGVGSDQENESSGIY